MQIALNLAKTGLGTTYPNPSVGCIIVKDDIIIGRGRTQEGGRPHAEKHAIKHAIADTNGATMYVTLEPCCHQGKAPPCTKEIIKAGIKRIFIATPDPDKRVAGNGIKQLHDAGITVELGLCQAEANEINYGFFKNKTKVLPQVSLKIATSLDGKIATSTYDSKWITSDSARNYAHKLRSTYDAILIGSNTALKDDPSLTCRIAGLENRSPIRVILDRSGKVTDDLQIIQTAQEIPTVIFTEDKSHKFPYVKIIHYNGDIKEALEELAKFGITRVLVEGGSQVAASLIKANLVDKIYWFHAPVIIGGDGIPSVSDLGFDKVSEAPRFKTTNSVQLGVDRLTILHANGYAS